MKTLTYSKHKHIDRNRLAVLWLLLLMVGGIEVLGFAAPEPETGKTAMLPDSSPVNRTAGIATAVQSDAGDASVKLDNARAASQLITPAGGILEATAEDGTAFRLTLPAGALLSEEEITLTPVTAVDGARLSGGLAGAVQIAPEDLLFYQPATLEVEPTTPPTPEQEIPFGWSNQGEDLHLHALLLPSQLPRFESSSITTQNVFGWVFNVASGGGLGLGRDDASDYLLWWLKQTPCKIRNQLEHELQQELGAERLRQLQGNPPNPAVLTNAISKITRFYKSNLKRQIKQALKSKDEAIQRCALVNALSALRQAELLGLTETDPFYQTLHEQTVSLIQKGLQTEFDNAKKRCDVISMLGAERQAQLFGFPSLVGDISTLPSECNFQLVFDSQIVIVPSDSEGPFARVAVRVTSEIPVYYKEQGYHFTESAPLKHQTVTFEFKGCATETSYTDSVLHLTQFDPDLNIRVDASCKSGQECKIEPTRFVLAIYPDPLYETLVTRCPEFTDTNRVADWWSFFGYLHQNELSERGFVIRGLSLDRNTESPLVSYKRYRQTLSRMGQGDQVNITETTDIELRRKQ